MQNTIIFKIKYLDAKINDNGFRIFENEYGTYFYASNIIML